MKTTSTTLCYLSLVAGLVIEAGSVSAQSKEPFPAPIAFTFQIGGYSSGPTSAIRELMEANGLGGPAFLFGTYPIAQILPNLALHTEFFWSRSSLAGKMSLARGRIAGTHDALVRWRAISFAPLYSYYSRQRTTRISLGPSIQWIQTEAGTDPSTTTAQFIKVTRVVPGLVVEAGVRFPAQKPFFVELSGQYEAAFDQLHNELRFPFNGVSRVVPYDLAFNRFIFTIGLGFRLTTGK
ncbi:hypothetical protein [Spirosoma pollinicola]|uniref:Outer membrane protein beta-barrel domain-containing protein n=1 Tax=Spirosoma pollinicola TaxID=2057025 RepID=A0A2K8ZAH2_9BACT|nr:hypothetical protein [Spirosoma pollinicola]AUD06876.1 hypothetical protein CWM47_36545 [Spirosoma pollinicola]